MDAFGEAGVWHRTDGETVQVPVIYHASTIVYGELADRVDPRPHVQLPVAVVGQTPRGQISFLGRTFELQRGADPVRPVDRSDHHEAFVRVYVKEISS